MNKVTNWTPTFFVLGASCGYSSSRGVARGGLGPSASAWWATCGSPAHRTSARDAGAAGGGHRPGGHAQPGRSVKPSYSRRPTQSCTVEWGPAPLCSVIKEWNTASEPNSTSSCCLEGQQADRLGAWLERVLFSHQVMSSSVATSRLTACQPSLSMGFSKQESWSGFPFLSPGDLPNSEIQLTFLALAGSFFTTEPLRKPNLKGWVNIFSSYTIFSPELLKKPPQW